MDLPSLLAENIAQGFIIGFLVGLVVKLASKGVRNLLIVQFILIKFLESRNFLIVDWHRLSNGLIGKEEVVVGQAQDLLDTLVEMGVFGAALAGGFTTLGPLIVDFDVVFFKSLPQEFRHSKNGFDVLHFPQQLDLKPNSPSVVTSASPFNRKRSELHFPQNETLVIGRNAINIASRTTLVVHSSVGPCSRRLVVITLLLVHVAAGKSNIEHFPNGLWMVLHGVNGTRWVSAGSNFAVSR